MSFKFIFSGILLFGTLFLLAASEPIEDKQALLDFLGNISHSRPLNWNESTSCCYRWTGVNCNHNKSRIISVRLPGVGFYGRVPSNTLSRLSALHVLSLGSNDLSGPFPADLSKLGKLAAIYLESNHFSGPLPSDFSVWQNVSVIDLSNNSFNGSIPSSISNLTHLTSLNLAENSFSGVIPELDVPSLQNLNLSNNRLNGSVPQSLDRFPSWAFVGNNVEKLPSSVLPSNSQPSKKPKRLCESAMVGIIIGCSALGVLVFVVVLIVCCCCSKKGGKKGFSALSHKSEGSEMKVASGSQGGNARLEFFNGGHLAFDLEDLLRASAEVLGKGTFGTTYKASLEDATTVVVKRLKEVSLARREFEQQMEVVGSIRHENVAALTAYYYSKDEKLVVYDYYDQGSVSAMLHSKRGGCRTPLDWETRLGIAIGAARGIAHIHTHNGWKLVHGNIKASNIFLNPQQFGCVSDLGLASLMSPMAPPVMESTGYRAPEVTDTHKVTQASDVFSFGVLLLELLTGKSSIHPIGDGEFLPLVKWVNSVLQEEWTAEVFDVELLRCAGIEDEMLELLQIGLSCTSRMPEKRPKMVDVVKMVEDIRRPSPEYKSGVTTPTLTTPVPEIGSPSVS
ncbi:probable inactive receptor kinase At4g23740 [Cornus florida]|uniref:probable inactive receptor kinase At4g23740 n=1 Tax=Cornus florida TaxID=4283 RepID=UPI00289A8DD3|nr:probable inactive receptor kinase At4g23740 [Cornus florida]